MHEIFTGLIEKLENDPYGEMVIDTNGKGTLDDPLHLPYAAYTDAVIDLWKAIYAFSKKYPKYELTNYQDVLANKGFE